MRKLTAFILALALAFSLMVPAVAYDKQAELSDVLAYYKTAATLEHWWEAVALASAGESLSGYTQTAISEASLKNGVTTYVGYIYQLAAQGKNPRQALGGIDLVAELAKKQLADGSFGYLNETLYAMLALNRFGGSYNEEKSLSNVLSLQLADGGFCYDPEFGSDVNVTGMALSTLALFMDKAEVEAAVDKAIAYLHDQQQESGGFLSWGAEDSNTLAVVITGLVDIGEDVFDESWKNICDSLVRFKLPDGSYKYQLAETEGNRMATYQALTALDAVAQGKSMWLSVGYTEKAIDKLYKDAYKVTWAEDYIVQANTLGLMSGDAGLFRPTDSISRAEFTKIVLLAAGIELKDTGLDRFDDVVKGDWFYYYVETAASRGIVGGITNDIFAPNARISRQDAATIIARTLSLTGATDQVKDLDEASDTAKNAIMAVYEAGIMTGDNGVFMPHASMTREQAAKIAVLISQLDQ